MDDDLWFTIGFVAIVVVLGVIAFLISKFLQKKRTDQLRGIAAELSLEFLGNVEIGGGSAGESNSYPEGLGQAVACFSLFSHGSPSSQGASLLGLDKVFDLASKLSKGLGGMGRRSFRNVIHGKSEQVELSIFDYSYSLNHDDEDAKTKTIDQTVISFRRTGLDLPQFSLRPEGAWDKVKGAVGFRDINFSDFPEFSRRYMLQGANEDGVRRLFTATLIESFEKLGRRINIEAQGDQLIIYTSGNTVTPKNLQEFFQMCFGVYSQFAK